MIFVVTELSFHIHSNIFHSNQASICLIFNTDSCLVFVYIKTNFLIKHFIVQVLYVLRYFWYKVQIYIDELQNIVLSISKPYSTQSFNFTWLYDNCWINLLRKINHYKISKISTKTCKLNFRTTKTEDQSL